MFATILMVNLNWFKRQDHKLAHTIQLKKLELQHKKSMKKLGVQIEKTPFTKGNIDPILKMLGKLDDDTILSFVDALRDEGYEIPGGSSDMLGTILQVVPKDVIKGIAQGFIKGASKGKESDETYKSDFWH